MQNFKKKREILQSYAQKCLGKLFKYGATSEEAPEVFDCSSLVQYLYQQIGINLPRTSLEQAHLGTSVSFSQLEIGDLLFFRGTIGRYNTEFPQGIGHVAMYIGNDQVIHAVGKEGKVIQTTLEEIRARTDFVVAKKLLQGYFPKLTEIGKKFKLK